MKKILVFASYLGIIIVLFANIYLFLQGLTLGTQIGKYEKKIVELKQENIDLEQKVYAAQSYTFAAGKAATLNFTKSAEPIYIDNLLYAKNF